MLNIKQEQERLKCLSDNIYKLIDVFQFGGDIDLRLLVDIYNGSVTHDVIKLDVGDGYCLLRRSLDGDNIVFDVVYYQYEEEYSQTTIKKERYVLPTFLIPVYGVF